MSRGERALLLLLSFCAALLPVCFVLLLAIQRDTEYLRDEVDPNSVPQCFQAQQLEHDVTRSVAVPCEKGKP